MPVRYHVPLVPLWMAVRDLTHDICMAKRPLNYDIGWPFSGFGQPLLYFYSGLNCM